jgi:hypothetical protein
MDTPYHPRESEVFVLPVSVVRVLRALLEQ